MAKTTIGINDPKAVKRWSGLLTYDVLQKTFFSRFTGKGEDSRTPVQILTDLESDAGEMISYDLLAELKMAPVEGEDTLEGKEEQQRFYTDTIYIDQARGGVNTGGAMTRKRTLHKLRENAKRQQSSWWGRLIDELLFVYLSGARGVNSNFILPPGFAGRAGNIVTSPDANHHLFSSDDLLNFAHSLSELTRNHAFSLSLIDRAKTQADNQGGGATGIPVLQPCMIDGEETFVCVMHPFQENDLRRNTLTGQWLDIQRAAATALGKDSPLFKNALGMYRGCILHSHKNVIRFNNAGPTGDLGAARALFMGSQAAVMAYGSPGTNQRFDWHEETRDDGDKVVITSSSIFGTKKVSFDTPAGLNDVGVFALDTVATER